MDDPGSPEEDIATEGLKQAGNLLQIIVAKLNDTTFLFGVSVMILALVGLIALALIPNFPSQFTWFPFAVLVFGVVLIVLAWIKTPSKPEPSQPKDLEEEDASKSSLQSMPLGVPTAGKLGLLVDLSHQQNKWRNGSIFDLPLKDNNLSALFILPSYNLPWYIREVGEANQFQEEDLTNWRGLVFGMPWHQIINIDTINAIKKWVLQGGRLILLGYELGERHHQNNINDVSDRLFGIKFNSDIVAPKDWQHPSTKPFGKEIIFNDINPSKHDILKDVKKLCMRNICTLTTEPGSRTILSVGMNRISREINPQYTDGWTSSGTQKFEIVPDGEWFPVIAEAPQSLCGKGRIIAIGTWDFFGVDDCFKNNDNYIFLKNLLTWCLER